MDHRHVIALITLHQPSSPVIVIIARHHLSTRVAPSRPRPPAPGPPRSRGWIVFGFVICIRAAHLLFALIASFTSFLHFLPSPIISSYRAGGVIRLHPSVIHPVRHPSSHPSAGARPRARATPGRPGPPGKPARPPRAPALEGRAASRGRPARPRPGTAAPARAALGQTGPARQGRGWLSGPIPSIHGLCPGSWPARQGQTGPGHRARAGRGTTPGPAPGPRPGPGPPPQGSPGVGVGGAASGVGARGGSGQGRPLAPPAPHPQTCIIRIQATTTTTGFAITTARQAAAQHIKSPYYPSYNHHPPYSRVGNSAPPGNNTAPPPLLLHLWPSSTTTTTFALLSRPAPTAPSPGTALGPTPGAAHRPPGRPLHQRARPSARLATPFAPPTWHRQQLARPPNHLTARSQQYH